MSGSKRLESLVNRRDDSVSTISNPHGVPITLFANRDVPVELEAVDQALELVSVQGTIEETWNAERSGQASRFWGDAVGSVRRVVLTPDFHRGAGIPVGTVMETERFVIPQAVGNDVCCGMRLLVTDVTRDELAANLDALDAPLRAVFFQGRREIVMSPRQREALLREGLWGLLETSADNQGTGVWRHYDARAQEQDLARVHFQGVLPARDTFAFGDYIQSSGGADGRDSQTGSVGGGNHFVELQVIEEILDGQTAHAWGVAADRVAIKAHSGSVGLGHAVGGHFLDRAREIFPRELRRPEHGFYVIPTDGPHAALAAKYLDAMHNAANFAFANRLFLGLLAVRVLSEVIGRAIEARLVYDAPHNLIWDEPGRTSYVHRKAAATTRRSAAPATAPAAAALRSCRQSRTPGWRTAWRGCGRC
jgi:tRNA-splicing ligase RtcB